jgi:hypothetical protein
MTKNNIISTLHYAGDLLADASRRCVGTLAQDHRGVPVDLTAEIACRWDLVGAVSLACFKLGIVEPKDQIAVYQAMKDTIGLDTETPAALFWDDNEDLHQLIAGRLQKA